MNSENPLVSICCITYNHENYIHDAIKSFLMQKTDFHVEILINDDASQDGTAEIIKEYELKYPDIVFPIYQKVNQTSKGIAPNPTFNYPRARGKYIAFCEGDDYWTDPDKLQVQVEFLETHPEYALCCGGYESLNEETGERTSEIETRFMKDPEGFSFGLAEMSLAWFTKPLTSVFRAEIVTKKPDLLSSYRYCRDVHLFYHLLKAGRGYYFNRVFGVYRRHPGGIKSMVGDRYNKNIAYERSKELYERNRDTYTKMLHLRSVSSLLRYNLGHRYPENTFSKNIKLFGKLLIFALSLDIIINIIKVRFRMLF